MCNYHELSSRLHDHPSCSILPRSPPAAIASNGSRKQSSLEEPLQPRVSSGALSRSSEYVQCLCVFTSINILLSSFFPVVESKYEKLLNEVRSKINRGFPVPERSIYRAVVPQVFALKSKTVVELKTVLTTLRLIKSGNKFALLDRLNRHEIDKLRNVNVNH